MQIMVHELHEKAKLFGNHSFFLRNASVFALFSLVCVRNYDYIIQIHSVFVSVCFNEDFVRKSEFDLKQRK